MYQRSVFPTHVGVFLRKRQSTASRRCLPHACGGVSAISIFIGSPFVSSPRMWGCFPCSVSIALLVLVFPTHVGVFLMLPSSYLFLGRLPHACGGVSVEKGQYRRCPCLPHACGGVSAVARPRMPICPSSPRMWGCFYHPGTFGGSSVVFPTHVGVFLSLSAVRARHSCLPHACGGVSFL